MTDTREGLGVALGQMQGRAPPQRARAQPDAYPYAERAMELMNRPENAQLEWVQRFKEHKTAPVLWNPDGSPSTHSMASGESDGRGTAYPTVVPDGQGGLQRLEDREAWEYSREHNNAMWFDTPPEALEFSRRYKDAWGSWMPTRE